MDARRLRNRTGRIAGALLALSLVLAACTGDGSSDEVETDDTEATGDEATTDGGEDEASGDGSVEDVTIGFSAPAADHGWIAAITENAQEAADEMDGVTLEVTEGTNDVNQQISQVETLINSGVDALVVLPFEGQALTQVAQSAMEAGIPVVNLDRIFASPRAYRTYIGGDNYGMGGSAGEYICERIESDGVEDPVIGEIAGIDNLPLTQDRSQGFADALESCGQEVDARVAAEFTVESGQEVTANLLQAESDIYAIWNHDDDQGIGVLAAIEEAGRDEFFMIGGAGSANAMREIESGESVLEATVLYSPSMASSAIELAALIARDNGMEDLAEADVPAEIITYSAVVTGENVDEYMEVGFES